MTTRREFLGTALAASAGVALTAMPTSAIEPIVRSGPFRARLSLAAYSYRQYLDLKIKPKPPMTLADFIDQAAGMDLDAVELTGYYFPSTDPEYLGQLKGRCTRLGLDISGSAVGNDFCVADPEKLKEQIAHVKAWTEHTSRLGGKALRIFAGRVAKGDSEEKALPRCIAAIEEACDHAARYGVYLALENHGGITEKPEQILAIIRGVKHPWFGVNMDTGNFHGEDPYAEVAALAPYSVNVQVKTEIQRKGQKKEEADLKRMVDILRASGYRGYVALEYEASEDPRQAVPRHLTALRKLLA